MTLQLASDAMMLLQGLGVSKGVVIGRAILMDATALDIPHYYVGQDSIEAECQRLTGAIVAVQQELMSLKAQLPADAPKELGPLLDVHHLLLSDPMLAHAGQQLICEHGYNAEWAISAQAKQLIQQFDVMEDDYIRERAADIRQVTERVITVLLGQDHKPLEILAQLSKMQSTIVVAFDISPADMVKLRQGRFAGFVTDVGGMNSHTAIVARGMGVPAVVAATNSRHLIHDNDVIIMDGETGTIIVNPSAEILCYYQYKAERLQQDQSVFWADKDEDALSLDGQRIQVHGNIETPDEVSQVLEAGGEGIGLYRTEFLFMGRDTLPSEEEQYQAYTHVLKHMGNRPVTIRTLDVGADKALNHEGHSAANPALGQRAIRYCLAHPEMFLTQLKALLRAGVHGQLNILIPMIAHQHEVMAVKALLTRAAESLSEQGVPFTTNYGLGVMVEIPAVAVAIDLVLADVDFVSIGTNDLIQYTLAIDRVDHNVSHLYDPLHPAILRLLQHVIQSGKRANKPVTVCGEMAGDALYTRLLLGLGLGQFSMNASHIPEVKHLIRQTDVSVASQRVDSALSSCAPIALDAAGFLVKKTPSSDKLKSSDEGGR